MEMRGGKKRQRHKPWQPTFPSRANSLPPPSEGKGGEEDEHG